MLTSAALASAALSSSGCASRGNVEALEAQLRQTQDSLRHSEQRMAKVQSELDLAHREKEVLRQQMTAANGPSSSGLPEQTQALARISGLSINRLMSGGKDQDGDQADEALQLIVAPHDADGDLVKVAGQMEIEAYDMSRTGEDKRVGRWVFDSGEARKHWHSGFLSSGFQFHLPWEQTPGGKEILVHARLVTSDGRQFDTNQTINVRPGLAAAPGRIVPPAQLQQVSQAKLAPLSAMPRRSRVTTPDEVQTVSVEAGPVSVGRAQLDFLEDVTVEDIDAKPALGAKPSPWASKDTSPTAAPEGDARPVPPPRDVEPDPAPAAPPSTAPWKKAPAEASAPPRVAPAKDAKPLAPVGETRPFPRGLSTTSDNWTDETIPVLR
ncbi:hypothetical protein [Planctomyces sp. SH-PL14]|uniref:hypothetical protein n=1 Tax=Planctomyces sp. SH-PL14 TaxID=1632864 RepID=UPI00094675ED|nr:hypothetical protein [Planctomyces sp. SH-PL14]